MRILHSYCLNYNIGDYALGIGVRNLLRHFLKVDLIGTTNLQGRYFDKYYINEVVNKKYDLLVIGGGGIIHGAHWPNGWFWLIDVDLIKTIKIPFIIYGAGVNYFEQEGEIPDKAKAHLRETFKRAAFFSVRNDGSYDRLLKQTNIKAYELPDPGFHINLNQDFDRIIKEPYVVIQLADDKPEYRFGGEAQRSYFIHSMREAVKNISKEYKIIFAPHVIDDIKLSKQISKGIKNCTIWDFGYFAFDHPDIALGYYKYAEFVLAMRGHGQIVPIAFNTPVISLENHPKHSGLMKNLGLYQYNVQILDQDFKSKLMMVIKKVLTQKNELEKKYLNINQMLFNQSSSSFKKIKVKLDDCK